MKPTSTQLARAYHQVRRPDWPWASADELAEAKRRVDQAYTLTNACAASMANGHALAPVPAPIPPAAAPKPVQTPAPHFHRRRDDGAVDLKRAASGDTD